MPSICALVTMGKATACEVKSPTLDVPPHLGKIWIDDDVICLQFPSIDNIVVSGRTSLQIVSHMVRFPANEKGIAAAEAILDVRQRMMQKGNEAMLLAFAEHGTDHSEILRLYKEIGLSNEYEKAEKERAEPEPAAFTTTPPKFRVTRVSETFSGAPQLHIEPHR